MNARVLRAQQLMAQSRWCEAAEQIRSALADDPQDARAHAVLALCLASDNRPHEALAEAEAALACDAGEPLARYARAEALYADQRTAEAEAAARECLVFTPDDPDCHALIAACRMRQEDRLGALAAVEAGLLINPTHHGCRTLRGQILVLLGRRDEAADQHSGDLARDPDDGLAHANAGYARLHASDPGAAARHFAEALRLNPDDDYARAGLVEALKSRNLIYRGFLAYGLWMARLSPGTRWLVLIVGYLGFRVSDRLGLTHPEWALWLAPLVWGYLAFAITTWLAVPLFNLILMTDRHGRHALSGRQRLAAVVAGGLAVGAGAAAIASATAGAIWLLTALLAAMVAPLWNQAIDQAHPRLRRWLPVVAAAMSFFGVFVLGLIAAEIDMGACLLGWFTWCWIACIFAPALISMAGR
ncbi:hypothetical protein LBMAG53_29790 [Planctomycetota bacterium]|nr:hypothetical protein LBMAG53_29790 [Planctomycetota bacterium]